ncbi:MAG: phospho-sugar mutase [Clostridiales Family XIII bacterium]|jgi:phosphoglucomutase|nr:phospho-sugar mutase [Clostridiales Family XIII bacterium]
MSENLQRLNEWLKEETLDATLRGELESLLTQYEKVPNGEAAPEIADRFYRELEFGTAGMRGIMGAGLNRINVHTIRRATQGFAAALTEIKVKFTPTTPLRVAIAYDNRLNSDLFAYEAACVFAANGIEALVFGSLSATPLLSYAVRELNCLGGLVITASHNSKRYNGYKIYDDTGCQCLEGLATRVSQLIELVDIWKGVKTVASQYSGTVSERLAAAAENESLIQIISEKVEQQFVEDVLKLSLGREGLSNLNVVYTPLNGTGRVPVSAALAAIGVGSLDGPKAQMEPDPYFTTCPEPNPEKMDALSLGLSLCREKQGLGNPPDILIGTDPDCDRVGVAVFHGGDYLRLTGNQIGVLLLDYIIERRIEKGDFPKDGLMVTTIVSSPLASVLAEEKGLEVRKVLTGFKYIGETINNLTNQGTARRFLFGFEESCGYLSGTHVRDKDAVNASVLICEMAARYKTQSKTLLDRLQEIYETYGYFVEELQEFAKPGADGMAEIAAMMQQGRNPEMQKRFSVPVVFHKDYAQDKNRPANVIEFNFEDGSRAILRPSGTEPKLKIYYFGRGKTQTEAEAAVARVKGEMKFL